uniref:Uncharacterized protein n=1 Tax=Arundo donax TaxID=35708 RepID=A0A0A8XXW0_ARUDO
MHAMPVMYVSRSFCGCLLVHINFVFSTI